MPWGKRGDGWEGRGTVFIISVTPDLTLEFRKPAIHPFIKRKRNIQKKITGQLVFYQMSIGYNQINAYFKTILPYVHCSFWKAYSSQHCLIVIIEKCCNFLDKGSFSSLLMTDVSKAFDCIDHKLLIARMHAYGFKKSL